MMRTNDHRIRILAVYTMLKNTSADKPITAKKILRELDKQYHIKAALTTIYVDVDTIRLFANIRSQSGKGFWIEQGNAPTIKSGDTFYYVYFFDDKKRYEVDKLVAEEVSDKRVWTDNGCCEIGINEFGKFAFLVYEKAKEAAERLNNEK